MFRSLFAKILITITLVLTVSFLILSITLADFVNSYERGEQEEALERTAEAAEALLADGFSLSTADDFEAFLAENTRRYETFFRVHLANTEDTVLLLCDLNGKVLLSEKGATDAPSYVGKTVDRAVVAQSLTSGEFHGSAPLFEGEAERLACAHSLLGAGGREVGVLITFSTAENFGELTRTLIRTVLVTSLWIILGALVILYLFCEHVAGPLREMGHVTKRFAKGEFDSRVTVEGNDEIASLGIAFNQMADSLEQLETMRNSFISNVSHDLRTPMTTILGFVEGITSGAIPPDKHEYYLGIIAGEVRRLSRLVTELLDLSRLQSGTRKFNFSNFDICEMARLILIANEQRIDEKRLDVVFDAEADNMLVCGDRDAIHQVLYNLCDNAIKFAKEGGIFSLKIVKEGKKKLALTVFNEGEGIPESEIPFVFDRFYKTDKSRGRDKSGAGLGLYIAKTIMDAHKETLTLESREGEYCAFTFTLPLSEE